MRVQNVLHTFYPRRENFVSNDTRFQSYVLVAPERGEFRFETENESGICGFGELVVAAPNQKFERTVTSEALTYHVLQWSFARKTDALGEGLHVLGDLERLTGNFARLRPLLGRGDDWTARRRENLLEELLLLALETRQKPLVPHDEIMQRAARLLRENAGHAFSMRFISDQVDLKPVQFTRRFRAATGQTPIDFLTQIRLENAAQLLVETPWTLERIAKNCGYATPFYLSNLFSKRFRQSPSEFRRKHRV